PQARALPAVELRRGPQASGAERVNPRRRLLDRRPGAVGGRARRLEEGEVVVAPIDDAVEEDEAAVVGGADLLLDGREGLPAADAPLVVLDEALGLLARAAPRRLDDRAAGAERHDDLGHLDRGTVVG